MQRSRDIEVDYFKKYIGALFGYTDNADLCVVTDVLKTGGTPRFVYYSISQDCEFGGPCPLFFLSDIVWHWLPAGVDPKGAEHKKILQNLGMAQK